MLKNRLTSSIRKGLSRRKFLKAALAMTALGALPKNVAPASPQGPFHVVIVGGGLAGLTAANKLRDLNVLVLEKEKNPGGRIINGQWRGFSYARGAEYMGPPEDDVADLLNELGLKPVRIPPPVDAVGHAGKTYWGRDYLGFLKNEAGREDYRRLMDLLETLNAGGLEDWVLEDQDSLRRMSGLDRLTVEAWMKSNSVDSLVRRLMDVENRGLFGAGNRELSMLFNIPEMSWNMVDPEEKSVGEVFSFPKGMSEMVWALQGSLGPKLVTGAEVVAIEVENNEARVSYRCEGTRRTVECDCVVVASPAPITAAILKNGISEQVREALGSIPYTTYAVLNLFLKKRFWKDAWALSCLDSFFVTLYDAVRLQVKADHNGECILGVYIAPDNITDQYLITAPEKEILARTIKDLENYFPGISNHLIGSDLQRFRYAFPVFQPGYLDYLEILHRDETSGGPVILAGDYMVYATIDGAVRSGCRAAELARDWLED